MKLVTLGRWCRLLRGSAGSVRAAADGPGGLSQRHARPLQRTPWPSAGCSPVLPGHLCLYSMPSTGGYDPLS